MSSLQGNFKPDFKKLVRAVHDYQNGRDIPSNTCPKNEVPQHFHAKTYSATTFNPSKKLCEGIEDDERIDYLLRMKHNITEYFDNTVYTNPYGMTAHDYKSVGLSRRECLEDYKMKTRRDDYMYLSKHPEIDAMIELLLRKLMTELPCNPVTAIAEFFCLKATTNDEHKKKIDQEREKIMRYRKSKSKEFFLPKLEPVATIRKLNLGPLADILDFSKPQEKEPELIPTTEPQLDELLTEQEPLPQYNPTSDEEEEEDEELYPGLFEDEGLQNTDIFEEETDGDGNLLNQDYYPTDYTQQEQSESFDPPPAEFPDMEYATVDADTSQSYADTSELGVSTDDPQFQ